MLGVVGAKNLDKNLSHAAWSWCLLFVIYHRLGLCLLLCRVELLPDCSQ